MSAPWAHCRYRIGLYAHRDFHHAKVYDFSRSPCIYAGRSPVCPFPIERCRELGHSEVKTDRPRGTRWSFLALGRRFAGRTLSASIVKRVRFSARRNTHCDFFWNSHRHGILHGMASPLGMRLSNRGQTLCCRLSGGINGAASVLASVLAVFDCNEYRNFECLLVGIHVLRDRGLGLRLGQQDRQGPGGGWTKIVVVIRKRFLGFRRVTSSRSKFPSQIPARRPPPPETLPARTACPYTCGARS